MYYITVFLMSCLFSHPPQTAVLWRGEGGKVEFTSDAPLELIQASSNKLKGIIDPEANQFAFSIDTRSFEGFNSALQQEHFHENYLESKKYPTATFTGKFIEDISTLTEGSHQVRAKGSLKIHGQAVERIIKCTLLKSGDEMSVQSDFLVPLEDHDISIPQVVYQKIAEEIKVKIQLSLRP